jgi:Xaa-Pro aminopeptidase
MLELFDLGKGERERRWQNIRNHMRQRGINVLVIWGFAGYNSSQCANFRYLSNIPTFGNLAYPGYIIFPLEGEPTIIGFAPMPADKLWIQDIRGKFPTYSQAIMGRIIELGCDNAAIGIINTRGADGEIGFPYSTYVALRSGLPHARIEDCTDILEETRMIKSDDEIRCLELGCDAANEVIEAIMKIARPGVRDCEVVAKILETLVRNGCEVDSLFLYGSGQDRVDAGKGPFLNPRYLRLLAKGDMIHMEFDAKYNGYVAQHNQVFALGEPDGEWKKVAGVAAGTLDLGLKY